MQRMRDTLANTIMVKSEAGDEHSIYWCFWNSARTNQCHGMVLFYWKILNFYYKWSFFPSPFTYFRFISVQAVFPLFTIPSLCQPIHAYEHFDCKKMLFIFKLIISVPRLFWYHRIHCWCFLRLRKQLNHKIEEIYIINFIRPKMV